MCGVCVGPPVSALSACVVVKDFFSVFVCGVHRSAHFHPAIAPAGISTAKAHHSPTIPPATIPPLMAKIIPKNSGAMLFILFLLVSIRCRR